MAFNSVKQLKFLQTPFFDGNSSLSMEYLVPTRSPPILLPPPWLPIMLPGGAPGGPPAALPSPPIEERECSVLFLVDFDRYIKKIN